MGTIHCKIVHYSRGPLPPPGSLLTVEELSRMARVHPEMIECFMEWELVEPSCEEPEVLFADTVVARIRRILRLRRDLGINWAGIAVVMDLLDRIDAMERKIERLQSEVSGP